MVKGKAARMGEQIAAWQLPLHAGRRDERGTALIAGEGLGDRDSIGVMVWVGREAWWVGLGEDVVSLTELAADK